MSRIKLSHDLNELADKSDNQFLIMKDKSILDDSDGDEIEMENVDLADHERIEANKRLAKHGKKYNPYEDDWESTYNEAMLSKYDDFDEIERARRVSKTVRLEIGKEVGVSSSTATGAQGSQYNAAEELPSTLTIGSISQRQYGISKPVNSLAFQSDYYTTAEVSSFSKRSDKPKKKRKARLEDEDIPVVPKATVQFIPSAEEDEELYAQLSRLRRIESTRVETNHEDQLVSSLRASRNVDLESSVPATSGVADFLSRIVPSNIIGIEAPETESATDQAPSMEIEAESVSAPIPKETIGPDVPLKTATKRDESTTSDIKVDGGLACALKFFSSRGELEKIAEQEASGPSAKDAKEAYNQLSADFKKRRHHTKKYRAGR